jgi:hypothetical protein
VRQGVVDDPSDTWPVVPPGRGQILHFPKASAARGPIEGNPQSASGITALSSADLFALLWQALADVLGTAATATLLRRAAQRAAVASPELAALSITREALEYQYKVPDTWGSVAPEPPTALCNLVRELWVFLVELTGSVVVARLLHISELRDHGIVPPREQQP